MINIFAHTSLQETLNSGKRPSNNSASTVPQFYLAARSKAKFDLAIEEVQAKVPGGKTTLNIKYLVLNLSSLASVRSVAQKVLSESEGLDILMSNGSVLAAPGLSSDGYELQLGTNYFIGWPN